MKPFLIIVFSFALLLVPQSAKAETHFSDIPAQATELQQAVYTLNAQNILRGYSDGTFRPNTSITREQFSVILARTLQLNIDNHTSPFADVPTDAIYSGSIRKLNEMGIITGFPDGRFHPKQPVTRLQAATMLNRAFQLNYTEDRYLFTDIDADNTHVKALYFNGITTGMTDSTFGPNLPITRGQASIFIYRILQMDKRGNVLYYKNSSLPITATQLVAQSDEAVRLVTSVNGLRVLPIRQGSGQFLLKGVLREATVPLEQYIAYSYNVTEREGQYFVTAEQIDLTDVLMHESHFYSYEALKLDFIPTAAKVVNSFEMALSPDLYYIGRNEMGLEISIFEPGEYTIIISDGTHSKQFQAQTTIQQFTTETVIMQ